MLADWILNLLQNLLYFALHLHNSSFPRPLTAKEEKEAFEAMQKGDHSSRDKLIQHNMRLVAHIIKKYYTNPNDQDDLISIGTIGLIKAVDSFCGDKGVRFATYASRCIENEVLMQFRAARKYNNIVFINDPIDTDGDGNSLTFLDVISDERDIGDELEHKYNVEQIRHLVNDCLTGREKTVIDLRYGLSNDHCLTQQQVAGTLGISHSYVSRIEKHAIERLKRCFFTEG